MLEEQNVPFHHNMKSSQNSRWRFFLSIVLSVALTMTLVYSIVLIIISDLLNKAFDAQRVVENTASLNLNHLSKNELMMSASISILLTILAGIILFTLSLYFLSNKITFSQTEKIENTTEKLLPSHQPEQTGSANETAAAVDVYDTSWFKEMIYAFAAAMDAKDEYIQKHSETVSQYSGALAAKLGMDDLEINRVSIAGLLHDVGKIGVPDHILNKPGKLTDNEFEVVKLHPSLGKNILEHVSGMNEILDYVEYHQERYDGKGYPKGLKGDEIPLGARVVAVADAFHAMTSSRPYRKTPLSIEEAIAEIKHHSGTQFDPIVAELFVKMIEESQWETDEQGNSFISLDKNSKQT
ncbi:HD-GYP domain-containing protein [Caldalkalibacillus mannanilyticus]|uniref:HD-GYP domain-containing protein n=1 Tax=Caldalkalibacillus mannanilyticus TaxID=1418 RepID=UPI0004697B95|nr:HD-GYP domain-containing protein [Caldalkalibacillus mannanilyticus]